MSGFVYCLVAIAVCAGLVFVIRKLFPVSPEVSRKLLHFTLIIVLTTWLYAFHTWIAAVLTMTGTVIVIYLILSWMETHAAFAALAKVTSERQPGEMKKSLCAAGLMFVLVTSVCWGLLHDRTLALASIFAWGPGDAAAALIGKRYGKTRIGREEKKSLEGTLAMFALSFLSILPILAWGNSFTSWQLWLAAFLTAADNAFVEFIVLDGFDTLFCPTAAAVVLCAMRILLPQ